MSTALYPGSFDPFHLGHLDTVEQATAAFDAVVVAVMHNPDKSGLLAPTRRVQLIAAATGGLPGVRVVAHDGLAVDAARSVGADAIVRSAVRGVGHELTMAATNQSVAGIETYLVTPPAPVAAISSTLVRGLLAAGDLDQVAALVPAPVCDALATAAA
jgi:pantetheine-phosphate adenylyltransferase